MNSRLRFVLCGVALGCASERSAPDAMDRTKQPAPGVAEDATPSAPDAAAQAADMPEASGADGSSPPQSADNTAPRQDAGQASSCLSRTPACQPEESAERALPRGLRDAIAACERIGTSVPCGTLTVTIDADGCAARLDHGDGPVTGAEKLACVEEALSRARFPCALGQTGRVYRSCTD